MGRGETPLSSVGWLTVSCHRGLPDLGNRTVFCMMLTLGGAGGRVPESLLHQGVAESAQGLALERPDQGSNLTSGDNDLSRDSHVTCPSLRFPTCGAVGTHGL